MKIASLIQRNITSSASDFASTLAAVSAPRSVLASIA